MKNRIFAHRNVFTKNLLPESRPYSFKNSVHKLFMNQKCANSYMTKRPNSK